MQYSENHSDSVDSNRAVRRRQSVPATSGAHMSNTDLCSIREAMEILGGISRGTIYKLMKDGRLASVSIGRRRFIRRQAIEDLVAGATTTRLDAAADHRQMPLGFEFPRVRGRYRRQ